MLLDAKKAFLSHQCISDDYIENIIPWYVPKWFGDIINNEMPWGLTYEKTMRLYKDGLIEPSHELIINKLPNAIVEHKQVNKKHTSFYKPEILTRHKETLDEHIWFLFEEESSINSYSLVKGLISISGKLYFNSKNTSNNFFAPLIGTSFIL